ncbi:gamma-glutamyltransferase [Roseibium sp.]|uniref:gamma-glutamyltransferase n=1 Tax=Roseibium sp. TaxID=1936156 RepID=UPI003B520B0A
MTHSFSRSQTVRKPVVSTQKGVVAAQHVRAAEIGADVLANGGNAVDAAVAVSFAMGVLEPWMSGPTGGGAMMIWLEKEQKAHAIWFGMKSPKALKPSDYPLSGEGQSSDLFPWKAVVDDRNVQGAAAIAVPGTVAGAGLAHQHFGSMAWKDLLQPAVEVARDGLHVDWYAALMIASACRALAKDPDAAAQFLEDGQWPTIAGWTALSEKRIDQTLTADTLAHLAEAGARDFYHGDIALALAKDVQAKGGSLSVEDLGAYQAVLQTPKSIRYRDARWHVTPGFTAGPTLERTCELLQTAFVPHGVEPDGTVMSAYAKSIQTANAERMATMGDQEDPNAPSCTTHFSIVDRDGNMVAMTQTLLSLFGSRVVSPSTGLLMNNGIMWFDPEPGRPNSLGPDKTCLMNVCPLIGEAGDRRFAVGASGGRKIMPAVAQLSSYLSDYGMSLEEAFHHPRIDVSGGDVVVADEKLPVSVLDELKSQHTVVTTPRTVFPYAFACPAGVLRENGLNMGCTEIMSPWGDAVIEGKA